MDLIYDAMGLHRETPELYRRAMDLIYGFMPLG